MLVGECLHQTHAHMNRGADNLKTWCLQPHLVDEQRHKKQNFITKCLQIAVSSTLIVCFMPLSIICNCKFMIAAACSWKGLHQCVTLASCLSVFNAHLKINFFSLSFQWLKSASEHFKHSYIILHRCKPIGTLIPGEIAFPGQESELPGLDRDAWLRPSTYFYRRDRS